MYLNWGFMGDVHKRKKVMCSWKGYLTWYCDYLQMILYTTLHHRNTYVWTLKYKRQGIIFHLTFNKFHIKTSHFFKWQSCTSVESNAMITSQTTVLVILVSFCYKKGAVGTKWNLSAHERFSSHIWSDACSP